MVASTNCPVYSTSQPLTGRHANPSPWSGPTLGCPSRRAVAGYLRALPAGDLDASVAALSSPTAMPASRWTASTPTEARRPERLLRAAVLHRRRHPSGPLRRSRRRARTRPAVPPPAVGHDAGAAAGRRRCLRPGVRAASSPRASSTTTSARRWVRMRRWTRQEGSIKRRSRRVSVLRLDRRLTTGPGAAHQRTILLRSAAGDSDTRLGGSCCG